ncbi:MAG TPA: ferrous iron transport protein A [Clostridiales bacterium]|jgi:ferrous iron transport protein A|nr:ferrous iron transport protein A [Clostridiales bacterium]
MTLKSAVIGDTYVVEAINLDIGTRRRLGALGITRGTPVRMLNRNRGGTVILMVRGSRLAVGKRIAKSIEIRRLSYEKRIKCRVCR